MPHRAVVDPRRCCLQVHKGKLRLPQRRRRARWPRLGFRLSACAQRRDDCTWRVSAGQDLVLGAPGSSRQTRALLDGAPGAPRAASGSIVPTGIAWLWWECGFGLRASGDLEGPPPASLQCQERECLLGSAPGEGGGSRGGEAGGGAVAKPEEASSSAQEANAAAVRRALAAVADRPGGNAGGIVAIKVRSDSAS